MLVQSLQSVFFHDSRLQLRAQYLYIYYFAVGTPRVLISRESNRENIGPFLFFVLGKSNHSKQTMIHEDENDATKSTV